MTRRDPADGPGADHPVTRRDPADAPGADHPVTRHDPADGPGADHPVTHRDPASGPGDDHLATDPIGLPGTALRIPTGWRCSRDAAPYLLVAAEPRDDTFAANLSVVREAAGDGDPLSTPGRLEGYLDSLAESLDGFNLIDVEAEVIAEVPGVRLLFLHHTTHRGLACEQWVRPDDEGTTIVSLTCLALDRDHFGPVFSSVAASWSVDDG